MRARAAMMIATSLVLVCACGSRTGLLIDGVGESENDSGPAHPDGAVLPDSPFGFDAPITFDGAPPPIDASVPDVPPPNDCPDADASLIYVLTEENDLYSFYPPTLEFTRIGKIACPTTASPYSMAVDRKGKAYSVFTDGNLFEVSTATAACVQTPFVSGQQGFTQFGMGFSGDQLTEHLFVAEAEFNATSKGLGSIDTTTFNLSFIAPFSQPLPRCELTGTGDNRLFGFCLSTSGASGSILAQIDSTNGNVVGENNLQVGDASDAFAFAFWGGSFWIFTGPGGSTTVTQYDPSTQTETFATTLPETVVGAGVSTCAPSN